MNEIKYHGNKCGYNYPNGEKSIPLVHRQCGMCMKENIDKCRIYQEQIKNDR